MRFHCLPHEQTFFAFTALLSDEEGEDGGDPDLHQCGHCKLMFNNLTKYITHKIQKVCWIDRNPVEEDLAWSPERNELSSPEGSNKEDLEEDEQVFHLHQVNCRSFFLTGVFTAKRTVFNVAISNLNLS